MHYMAKHLWTPYQHIHICLLNIPLQIDAMMQTLTFASCLEYLW